MNIYTIGRRSHRQYLIGPLTTMRTGDFVYPTMTIKSILMTMIAMRFLLILELKNGSLTIGELLVKGKSDKEYLVSTYICHPSLANDNLSGPVMTALLSRELTPINFSYRIIFVPVLSGLLRIVLIMKKL